MKHNQIEAPMHRVGHAITAVKRGMARLRHDRAIQLADAAIVAVGSKTPQDHTVNRRRGDRLKDGRLPILSFGGTARGAGTQGRDEDVGHFRG